MPEKPLAGMTVSLINNVVEGEDGKFYAVLQVGPFLPQHKHIAQTCADKLFKIVRDDMAVFSAMIQHH